MKPVNLNQLLFHPKSDSLSFYLPSSEDNDLTGKSDSFLDEISSHLRIQKMDEIGKKFENARRSINKIISSHPDKSHGFFLAQDFQGYVILDHRIEPYFITGDTFHVRPLLEESVVNPEFMLINISLYDIKIFRGDFQYLEIIQQYEFDQLPKNFSDSSSRLYAPQFLGLIPYKTLLALKTIAQKVMDLILYHSLPVIVTGLEEMKVIFLRYFDHSYGLITHIQEDFYEKTCVEISYRCRKYRSVIMDYYSVQLKNRLQRMMSSKFMLTDFGEIIKATYAGRINLLVIPFELKVWGEMDPTTGEYSIHKKFNNKKSVDLLNELAEEVLKLGGRIQIMGSNYFQKNTNAYGILKGQQ